MIQTPTNMFEPPPGQSPHGALTLACPDNRSEAKDTRSAVTSISAGCHPPSPLFGPFFKPLSHL